MPIALKRVLPRLDFISLSSIPIEKRGKYLSMNKLEKKGRQRCPNRFRLLLDDPLREDRTESRNSEDQEHGSQRTLHRATDEKDHQNKVENHLYL